MAGKSTFNVPSDYGDFVSSADSLLSQFKEAAATDFMMYKIFPDNAWSIAEATKMRQVILDFVDPLMENYIWHKGNFQLKVVLPSDGEPIYLAGTLEFGDNIEDEWFVVYLFYEMTLQLTVINVSLCDMDGEFLLIESASQIPDWLGPDNCDNRVWIRQGKLHIIPLDVAPSTRSGGISLNNALKALRLGQNTVAESAVQKLIAARLVGFPAKIAAHKHTAVCAVPKKVAELLANHPQMISTAVAGLGSERDKAYTRFMSSMSFFGATDTVLVPVTFTRALYAQITFQQRFHPPPRFHSAQRKLQQKGWDSATAKSFDLGCRVSCGLEIAYQKSRARALDTAAATEDRKYKVKRELSHRNVSLPADSDLSDFVVLSVPLSPRVFAEEGEPFLLDAFKSPQPLHEEIAEIFQIAGEIESPQSKKRSDCITEVSPNMSESDEWLLLTPEEFDSFMEARIAEISGDLAVVHKPEVLEEVQVKRQMGVASNPSQSDTQILSGMVAGMDKFIQASSALGGVGDDMAEAGSESDSSSDSDDGIPMQNVPSAPKPDGCTVFVGNLSSDVTEDQLHKFFASCGEITNINYSVSQGFARVQFVSDSCTEKALKKSGTTVNGRSIKVDYMPPSGDSKTDNNTVVRRANSKIRGAMISNSTIGAASSPGMKTAVAAETFGELSVEEDSDDDADAGALWKRTADDGMGPGSHSPSLPDIGGMQIVDSPNCAEEKTFHIETNSAEFLSQERVDRADTFSPFDAVLHTDGLADRAVTVALEIDSPTVLSLARGKRPLAKTTVIVNTIADAEVNITDTQKATEPESAEAVEFEMANSTKIVEIPEVLNPPDEIEKDIASSVDTSVDVSKTNVTEVETALTFQQENADLLSVLKYLELLDPPTDEEVDAILCGNWSVRACKKLEGLQRCLESQGTEAEWQDVYSRDDCVVIRYLLLFMTPETHVVLQDGASRCLAYGYVACPQQWQLYAEITHTHLYAYHLLFAAVDRVTALSENDGSTAPTKFMRGSVDCATAKSIWLLVIFQLFRSPVLVLNSEFRRWRLKRNSSCAPGEITTDQFLDKIKDLLYLTCDMGDETFSVCMKALAAINWQIPLRYSLESTEISDLCARMYYIENVPGLQLHQGLMNMLNDIGYPRHDAPEALPCLRLCYNLIMVPEYDGFFYTNDVEVISHIIVREVDNLSADAENITEEAALEEEGVFDGFNGPTKTTRGKAPLYSELMRQMYVRLATALMARSKWADVTRAVSQSEMLMQMIDKSNERPKIIEQRKQQTSEYKKAKSASTIYTEARKSSATDNRTDSDDDTLATDIWKTVSNKETSAVMKTTPALGFEGQSSRPATKPSISSHKWKQQPTFHVEDGVTKAATDAIEFDATTAYSFTRTGDDDSDDDTAVSDLWRQKESNEASVKRGPGKTTSFYPNSEGTNVASRDTAPVESAAVEDIEGSFQEYMDAMDAELSRTTMLESFERQGKSDGDDSYYEVDVEKNLLKNLLESHASTMGGTGPASNILSQMGVELPKPPHAIDNDEDNRKESRRVSLSRRVTHVEDSDSKVVTDAIEFDAETVSSLLAN